METMVIDVDIETARAGEGLQTVTQAVRTFEYAVVDADKKIEHFETSVDAAGAALKTTGQAVASTSAGLEELKERYGLAGDKAAQMGEKTEEAGEKAARGHKKAKQGADEHSSALDQVSVGVKSMIASYLGLNGVLKVWESINATMKDTIEAQAKLVGEKWQQDNALQEVMRNMPSLLAQGAKGQEQARALVSRLAAGSASSLDQSVGAIAAANANNFNLEGKPGTPEFEKNYAITERVAKMGAVGGLDRSDNELTFKMLSQVGVESPEDADEVMAAFRAIYGVTGETNFGSFMKNALLGAGEPFEKSIVGMKDKKAKLGVLKQVLARYSTFVSGAPNSRRGAMEGRQLFEIAETTEEKTKAFLAGEAASRGVTKVAPVSDADVEKEVATDNDSQEAIGIRGKRQSLTELDAEEKREEAAHEIKLKALRKRHKRAEIDLENARYEDARLKHAADRQAKQTEIGLHLRKIQEKLQVHRNVNAFDRLGDLQRVDLIRDISHDANADPEKMIALRAGLGGAPEHLGLVQRYGTPEYQKRVTIAQAAADTADPTQNEGIFQKYLETSPAQNQLRDTEDATADADAVEPGDEYAESFSKSATATADRTRMAMGRVGGMKAWWSKFALPEGPAFSKAWYDAAIAARRLVRIINAFWAAMTPEERQAFPEMRQAVLDAGKLQHDAQSFALTRSAESYADDVKTVAIKFGDIRARILTARRAKRQPTASLTGIDKAVTAAGVLNSRGQLTDESQILPVDQDGNALMSPEEFLPAEGDYSDMWNRAVGRTEAGDWVQDPDGIHQHQRAVTGVKPNAPALPRESRRPIKALGPPAPPAGKSAAPGALPLPDGAKTTGMLMNEDGSPYAMNTTNNHHAGDSHQEIHYHITQNVASQYNNDGGDGLNLPGPFDHFLG